MEVRFRLPALEPAEDGDDILCGMRVELRQFTRVFEGCILMRRDGSVLCSVFCVLFCSRDRSEIEVCSTS